MPTELVDQLIEGLPPTMRHLVAESPRRAEVVRELFARAYRAGREDAARDGYEQAIATLRGVVERTGSPAARWAADYLAADPDRLAPADYDDHGRWTRTDRPELISDRLGYPPERGDQDWAAKIARGEDQDTPEGRNGN